MIFLQEISCCMVENKIYSLEDNKRHEFLKNELQRLDMELKETCPDTDKDVIERLSNEYAKIKEEKENLDAKLDQNINDYLFGLVLSKKCPDISIAEKEMKKLEQNMVVYCDYRINQLDNLKKMLLSSKLTFRKRVRRFFVMRDIEKEIVRYSNLKNDFVI